MRRGSDREQRWEARHERWRGVPHVRPRHAACHICSTLGNYERATQHVHPQDDDSEYPAAAGRLLTVRAISHRDDLMSLLRRRRSVFQPRVGPRNEVLP